MATLVELFCSEGEVAETGEFLLSGAAESMKISSQHPPAPRGRKSTRIQAVRMKQKGRVSRGKDLSNQDKNYAVSSSPEPTVDNTKSEVDINDSADMETVNEQVHQTRRSCRTKTPARHFISEVQETQRRQLNTRTYLPRRPGQPDVNQDGSPFCCDKCGTNSIIKPTRFLNPKTNTLRRRRIIGIRYKVDPNTKKRLTLCNACGLQFDRMEKNQDGYKPPRATEQDKKKYKEDAGRFASSLVEGLKDPDAARLACLHISSKPCGCMQRYIIAEGNMEESRDRASQLLKMIKDAKKLKDKKSYNVEELLTKGKKFRKVGLGNGQKRSKEFEEFVLTNRQNLRNNLKFCERACQRILSYSNNFLHKRLKTEPEQRERIKRTKGQMALGRLKDVADLHELKCCEGECVMMAHTHAVLLKTWRERANSGQAEARKVLAEMLTPSGKVSNCATFITLVTGCSLSTIQSVASQMKETGGDREPPPHGLKKYWKNNPRQQQSFSDLEQEVSTGSRETQKVAPKTGSEGGSGGGGSGDSNGAGDVEAPALTQAQLRDQQQQLKRLQQQLEEQQRHVLQQQSLIEQQLQQHKLAMQHKRQQQKQRQQQQEQQVQRRRLQQQQQQQQQLTETQQEIMQAHQQQASSEEVAAQPAARQHVDTQQAIGQQQQQQATTQQQQMSQLAAQQQLLLQQLGAQQIAQQLAAQQQQVASAGTTVAAAQPPAGMEGMDSRLLQQNMQQLLLEIQNQINVQQNSMHQLLLEMQSEMTAPQLQQLGIPNPNGVGNGTSAAAATATPTITATASQPPPSYNAAVTLLNALNSGNMLNSNAVLNSANPLLQQQQQHQQQNTVVRQQAAGQPTQVIIQAIPTLQQNFLIGGAGLPNQLLHGGGGAGDSRQTTQQQILVSLAPSLTTECMTRSGLGGTTLTQDSLNSDIVEIVELPQITLSGDVTNQHQGSGIQQVNLTNKLDAATLAQLMGENLSQLHARSSRTATSTTSELAASLAGEGAVLQTSDSSDGHASSSSSLGTDAAQLNMNIESLLPEFQITGPAGQNLFKQNSTSKGD
ncbi:uncharacterized protein [Asterias amurensis]|uniref:uncharacterized protein isoform X2 n=1 Tax=Asterias amurensis TaxID=7602 RepID=UPI003AB7F8DF